MTGSLRLEEERFIDLLVEECSSEETEGDDGALVVVRDVAGRVMVGAANTNAIALPSRSKNDITVFMKKGIRGSMAEAAAVIDDR